MEAAQIARAPTKDPSKRPRRILTTEERRANQLKRTNYPLAGVLLGQGLELHEIVPRVGAATVESLRRGLYRKGITKAVATGIPEGITRQLPPSAVMTNRLVLQATDALREKLKEQLKDDVKIVAMHPSRTLSDVKERIEIIEPMARAAKIICGWGDNDSNSLVQPDTMSEVRETLEAEIIQDAPSPAQITDAQDSKSSASGESSPTNTGQSDTTAQ